MQQESVLSPLVFIMVLKVLLRENRTGFPSKELLYADDVALVADNMYDAVEKLLTWKNECKQKF